MLVIIIHFLLRHYTLYLGDKLVGVHETKKLGWNSWDWTMTELLHYVQVILPTCLYINGMEVGTPPIITVVFHVFQSPSISLLNAGMV